MGSKIRRGTKALTYAPAIEPGVAAKAKIADVDALLQPVACGARRGVRGNDRERKGRNDLGRPAGLEEDQNRNQQKSAAGADQRPNEAQDYPAKGGNEFRPKFRHSLELP